MRTFRSLVATIIVAPLLSGCSGEPGESDVREALKRNPMVVFGLASTLFDPKHRNADTSAMAKKILSEASIKIDGCVPAQGAPGFVCDFRVGRPDGSGQTQPMKGRFFEAEDGWRFEERR